MVKTLSDYGHAVLDPSLTFFETFYYLYISNASSVRCFVIKKHVLLVCCWNTVLYNAMQIIVHVIFYEYNIPTLLSTVCILHRKLYDLYQFNPFTAKLFNLNFLPLEVVSRWRDPQLQVSENYSDLTKWRSTVFKYCGFMSHFIFNMFKRWYLTCW